MGVQSGCEAAWYRLNDYEQTAYNRQLIGDHVRDMDGKVWTPDDSEGVRIMVQEMTGRLARVEERQKVLYDLTLATFALLKLIYMSVLCACAVYVIEGVLAKH